MELLKVSRKTTEMVCNATAFQHACSPLLFDPDLHARNIMVNPDNPMQI